MSDRSSIEWTDATWNPVTGCERVSPGCDNCYAETFAERFRGTAGHYFQNGFDVQLRPEKLHLPLRWKKPRRVFVNSMSDLFHAEIPDEYIARVWAVMALAKRHTFQLLTKRHSRLRSLVSSADFAVQVAEEASELMCHQGPGMWPALELGDRWSVTRAADSSQNLWSPAWPLPNVWVGVSVESQRWADIRIPALLDTPAAVRWLSCEPLLGAVDLMSCPRHRERIPAIAGSGPGQWQEECADCHWLGGGTFSSLDWVVVGGESGRQARPMHPDWARSLRDQCTAAAVPFLFKQWGEWAPEALVGFKGSEYVQMHPDGRVDGHAPQLRKVGKKVAGRELDGRIWDQYPEEVAAS